MTPHTLVLDAGPLIALFHAADPDHESAVRGFRALAREHSRLITSLPVVYEVYKWLLFEANALIAQQALGRMMEALEILPLRLDDLEAIQILLLGMQGWRGTLEDASVALLALRLKAPVWTLNYRDLEALKGLSFWARVTIPWSWV